MCFPNALLQRGCGLLILPTLKGSSELKLTSITVCVYMSSLIYFACLLSWYELDSILFKKSSGFKHIFCCYTCFPYAFLERGCGLHILPTLVGEQSFGYNFYPLVPVYTVTFGGKCCCQSSRMVNITI